LSEELCSEFESSTIDAAIVEYLGIVTRDAQDGSRPTVKVGAGCFGALKRHEANGIATVKPECCVAHHRGDPQFL
jgi:hypothetical protein